MFGRKTSGPTGERPEAASPVPDTPGDGEASRSAAPSAKPTPPGSTPSGFSPARSDIPQSVRAVAAKSEPARPDPGKPDAAKPSQVEGKKLMVGRDIFLSGEITACDLVIVEGRIEATLRNSNAVEIAESGMFKGTAEIEKADVSGMFEGDLTVRDRLIVRRSGRVKGKLRYGSIQIEPGGEISGAVEILPKPAAMPEAKVATGD